MHRPHGRPVKVVHLSVQGQLMNEPTASGQNDRSSQSHVPYHQLNLWQILAEVQVMFGSSSSRFAENAWTWADLFAQ